MAIKRGKNESHLGEREIDAGLNVFGLQIELIVAVVSRWVASEHESDDAIVWGDTIGRVYPSVPSRAQSTILAAPDLIRLNADLPEYFVTGFLGRLLWLAILGEPTSSTIVRLQSINRLESDARVPIFVHPRSRSPLGFQPMPLI